MSRSVTRLVLGLTACGLLACDEPTVCTANYVYGLTIFVADAVTNEPLVDDQTIVVARDGAYADTAVTVGPVYFAAGERPGIYAVTVERPGYQEWSQANIRVRGGECHVHGVTLQVRLTRTL